ncbi:hypothetical protein QEH59_09090 [Coraliomargarita sp. SDUM461004]|uniref:FecR protein domain-containing protein n=1 Tax=Thalassobacterium sedimentorum TaxID=3041258 RepID=A0ABU1AIK9_9BACT|nr:hypothetical protein [Coraliomargarita sp. SDUM461004]MDQ8194579.1 hypothetical protein [Coraliomargarita sp. SDUM461004]
MIKLRSGLKRFGLLCWISPYLLSSLWAQDMLDGSALITSRSGQVTVTSSAGQRISAKARDTLAPTGIQISTQANAHFILTLSNGVALALDAQTTLKCLHYTQRPFDKAAQDLGPEPSISKLNLQLLEGQLAVASNRLSPLSELRLQLPEGELQLHKGTCLIKINTTGLTITSIEGNLTYYYPNSQEREFIAAPSSVRISTQSMARQQIAESTTIESLDTHDLKLSQAAQHASKRVTFLPNDTINTAPEPMLIVPSEYFTQPDFRPYQFKH